MKNKVLLSTLLGGALLAGCTADDALDARKVAEGVNPAAPVFNILFNGDDDVTRAVMGERAIKWEYTDKMSLYHGGGNVTGEGENWKVLKNDNSDFLKSGKGWVRDFDAIYGMEDGEKEGDAPKFTTSSMVTEGLAIMIYPADTAYKQKDVNPHIYLTNEQDENTINQIPYISEVLKIGEYNGKNYEHTAGYGRNYDLMLRRIGGLLRLSLKKDKDTDLKSLGVDVDFRKVTINVDVTDNSNSAPFTTDLVVKVGRERRNAGKPGEGDELVGTNPEGHEYWMYSPWIEPATNGTTNTISTTAFEDYEGNQAAVFTLLPCNDNPNTVFTTFDANGTPRFGEVTVTVETNFGKVTVKEAKEDDKLLERTNGTKEHMKEGLAAFLKGVFGAETSGIYEGQLVATQGRRLLSVDLSDLNMKNLHVKDQDELMDVLKVYNALKKDKSDNEVTFILDGSKEEGVNKGKFVLDATHWKELETLLAEKDNKVSFALCDDETPCAAIVLDNEKNPAAEVPALQFATTAPDDAKVKSSVNVELVGKWKYEQVTDNKNTNDQAKIKNLVINDLVVTKGSEITLKNYIAAEGENVKIVVENGATATVSGVVTLQVNMDNKGDLNITADDKLAVDEEAILNNLEPQGLDATGWQKDAVKGGVINLGGTLAIVDQTTGQINNYGTIDVQDEEARILITRNAYDNANASKPFTNTQQVNKEGYHSAVNVFGVIFLTKKITDNQLTVRLGTGTTKTHTGFIKYDNSANAITKANYYIIKGNAKYAKQTYVEVDSSVTGELTASEGDVDVLILPKGTKMFCPVSVEVNKSLYVKGTITHTGGFKYGTDAKDRSRLTGYFGGDVNDYANIFSDGVDKQPEE